MVFLELISQDRQLVSTSGNSGHELFSKNKKQASTPLLNILFRCIRNRQGQFLIPPIFLTLLGF